MPVFPGRLSTRVAAAAFVVVLASGCSSTAPVADGASAAASTADDGLNATLWFQTAAEFEAVALQAYRLAGLMLERGLADEEWTASLEQARAGGFAGLPPAVVVDVDETVLDNSAYQARLVLEGTTYRSDSWNAWVEEARAAPIPGAVAFARQAHEQGVRVIYLTNRSAATEEATRRNLAAYGFPVSDETDVVLTRGERPGWEASDKTPRREAVAQAYRIVLLVGDNLGDFLGDVERSIAERAELVARFESFWGTRWIVIPNPMYGSWESAPFDHDFGRSPEVRRSLKRGALDPSGAEPPP